MDEYGLDPPLWLIATLASSIVNGGCFVVIEEGGWTFAAHACISHNTVIPSQFPTKHHRDWDDDDHQKEFMTPTGDSDVVNGGCFVVIEEGGWTFAAHACISHNTVIPSQFPTKHDHHQKEFMTPTGDVGVSVVRSCTSANNWNTTPYGAIADNIK